jgi:hypothetical protein
MTEQILYDTRAPGVISDELRPVIEELGLEENCRELTEDGWTIVENVADLEMNDRLHKAIFDAAGIADETGHGGRNMLLTQGPVFGEALLNPKLMAMAEFSVGRGFLLTQMAASVTPQGKGGMDLHSDNNWLPAPFPDHNQILTACWSTNGYNNKEGGSTLLIPGSQKLRRHPNGEETEAKEGAIGMDCPPNSAVFWDSNIWHANWPRTIPGQRVVVHISYNRLALRPVEDYSPWADELIAQHGPRMSQLLGRDDFLYSTEGFDSTKLYGTLNNAKS